MWRIDDLRIPVAGQWNVRVELLISDFDKLMIEDTVDAAAAAVACIVNFSERLVAAVNLLLATIRPNFSAHPNHERPRAFGCRGIAPIKAGETDHGRCDADGSTRQRSAGRG